MKTISKLSVIIFSVIITCATATNTFAVTSNGNSQVNSTKTSTKVTKNICTKVDVLSSASNATVTAHLNNMRTNFANRLTKIVSDQSEVDQKLATSRTTRVEQFDTKITELKTQYATSSNEKITAIDTYATKARTAEATRQTAVDLARTNYHDSLRTLITNKQTELTDAATQFKASISTAFINTKTTCAATTEISSLKSSIHEARQTYITASQSTNYKSAIGTLQTTRNAAIKAADDTFKAAMQEYKTALLAALSKDNL